MIDSLNIEAGHVRNRVKKKKPGPRAQILVLNKCLPVTSQASKQYAKSTAGPFFNFGIFFLVDRERPFGVSFRRGFSVVRPRKLGKGGEKESRPGQPSPQPCWPRFLNPLLTSLFFCPSVSVRRLLIPEGPEISVTFTCRIPLFPKIHSRRPGEPRQVF